MAFSFADDDKIKPRNTESEWFPRLSEFLCSRITLNLPVEHNVSIVEVLVGFWFQVICCQRATYIDILEFKLILIIVLGNKFMNP